MWSGDHPAADSCGRTAIGAGVAGAEGMYGPQAGGDVRPVPVQYGLRPAGVLAVADGLSSGAAGVEQTRSHLPVLRAAVRCPLCGGNESSCDPCPAGQAGPIAGRKAVDHSKGHTRICTVISLSGRAAVAAEPHTRCILMPHAHSRCPPPDGRPSAARKESTIVMSPPIPRRCELPYRSRFGQPLLLSRIIDRLSHRRFM